MNTDLSNILIKVRDLYMKYGIKGITMDDVSRELGISKKTLYLYVSDKDDLVGKVIDHEIEVRQEQICKCFQASFNAIEELFEISLYMNKVVRAQNPATEHDLNKYYPHHYEKMVKARREKVYNYILNNLSKGKQEGLYRDEMDEEIIAKLYISRIENIHLNEIFSVDEFTSVKLFKEMITYHVRGIATQKGLKVLERKLVELETKG